MVKQRIVVGGLTCLAMLVAGYQQKVFASALRDMVYRTPSGHEPVSASDCPYMLEMALLDQLNDPEIYLEPVFFWSDELTRAITQSFFVGFFVLSIPVGVAADYFGGRWLMGVGTATLSVCTLLFPTLAPKPMLFITGRLFQGAAHAAVMSSCIVVLAHWVPRAERSTFLGAFYAMRQLGVVFGQMQFRLFRELQFTWRTMLYVAGGVGLLSAPLLLYFTRDTPTTCRRWIDDQERRYIHSGTSDVLQVGAKSNLKRLVPWRRMFSSKPFLSMLLFHFGWSWLRTVLLHRVDNYLIHVLHLTRDLTYNCMAFMLTALSVSCVAAGVCGDFLVNNRILSATTHRKLFGFAGNVLALPLMLGTIALGCDGVTVCALLVVAFYTHGMVDSSFGANVLDLAPRLAGVSFAILNCVYAISVLFGLELYSRVCHTQGDRHQWLVFYLALASGVLVCSAPFLCLGSALVQPYNGWPGPARPVRDRQQSR